LPITTTSPNIMGGVSMRSLRLLAVSVGLLAHPSLAQRPGYQPGYDEEMLRQYEYQQQQQRLRQLQQQQQQQALRAQQQQQAMQQAQLQAQREALLQAAAAQQAMGGMGGARGSSAPKPTLSKKEQKQLKKQQEEQAKKRKQAQLQAQKAMEARVKSAKKQQPRSAVRTSSRGGPISFLFSFKGLVTVAVIGAVYVLGPKWPVALLSSLLGAAWNLALKPFVRALLMLRSGGGGSELPGGAY